MCICDGFKLAYPDMQLDPVVMRTRGMILIRDAVRQMDTIGNSGMTGRCELTDQRD